MIHNSSIKYSADFAKIEEPKIKEMMSFTQSVSSIPMINFKICPFLEQLSGCPDVCVQDTSQGQNPIRLRQL